MLTSEFDYHLPPELIAQHPTAAREDSRLLVVDRGSGKLSDKSFRDLPQFLGPGDILVLNNTRVFPARLHGQRSATGGAVEVLFLRGLEGSEWLALTRSGGKLQAGEELALAGGELRVKILERRGPEGDVLRLPAGFDLGKFLDEHGETPLPPYIARENQKDRDEDRGRYQTVYAARCGAIAAPTAGLHFSNELLAGLEAKGVLRAELTLHVGPGTFRPVKSKLVEDHVMDGEWYSVGVGAAAAINAARAAGGRCVAVGTTSTRTLETVSSNGGIAERGEGWSRLFIYPPYRFKAVDVLLTNFHLPKSTLLMLVSAFAGRELALAAYEHAVRERYRFYSYGDCCLFL